MNGCVQRMGESFTLDSPVLDISTGVVLADAGERCTFIAPVFGRGRSIGLLCEDSRGARFVLDPGAIRSREPLVIGARFADLPLDGHRVAGA